MNRNPLIGVAEQLRDVSRRVRKLEARENYARAADLPALSGKEYATLVVAAADSTAHGRAGADYVCDGVDDHVELHAALGALREAGGGKVVLLEGTYYPSRDVDLPSNVHIQGQGRGTMVRFSVNYSFCTWADVGSEIRNVTISDLAMAKNDYTYGVWISNNTFDVTIRDCYFEHISSPIELYADEGGPIEGVTISRCTFRDAVYGIDISGYDEPGILRQVTIEACAFESVDNCIRVWGEGGFRDTAAGYDDWMVTQCTIQQIAVLGNSFRDVVANPWSTLLDGNEYRNVDGLVIANNSWEGYYAPDECRGCQNVEIAHNAYHYCEYVCIYIRSDDWLARNIVIQGNTGRSCSGNFIGISNNWDANYYPDFVPGDLETPYEGTDNLAQIVISGNTAHDFSAAALYLFACNSLTITGNNIGGWYESCNLMYVWNAVVSGNTFWVEADSGTCPPIYTDDVGSLVITGNHVDRSATWGGIMIEGEHCVVTGNLITDTQWNGGGAGYAAIELWPASHCVVQGNVVRAAYQANKPSYGVMLKSTSHDNYIIGNDVRDGYETEPYSDQSTAPETNYYEDAPALGEHIAGTVGAHPATAIAYDNTLSGLAAEQVQAAIDELKDLIGGGGGPHADTHGEGGGDEVIHVRDTEPPTPFAGMFWIDTSA